MLGHQQRLWKRMQRGDPVALDEMLRLYYAPIYAYLRRLCRCPETAWDLTQETFAKALKALPSQNGSSNFKAWIYRIAGNVWRDSIRRADPAVTQNDEWWADQPSPNRLHALDLAEREQSELLWSAVERLDAEKRETIYLHYCQGLSLRETAQVLGVAIPTVKYRLRESIKSLREMVQDVRPNLHAPILSAEKEDCKS